MHNINSMQIGQNIQQKDGYKAFTPFDFPPKNGFVISPKLYKKHEEAIRLVGKLDGITRLLPDKNFFLLMFIKKDAAYSSQIEGTKATFQDAVAAPVTEEKSQRHPDVDDIVHYVDAVNYGIERTKTLPISLRLIREIHLRLMTKARSSSSKMFEAFSVSPVERATFSSLRIGSYFRGTSTMIFLSILECISSVTFRTES